MQIHSFKQQKEIWKETLSTFVFRISNSSKVFWLLANFLYRGFFPSTLKETVMYVIIFAESKHVRMLANSSLQEAEQHERKSLNLVRFPWLLSQWHCWSFFKIESWRKCMIFSVQFKASSLPACKCKLELQRSFIFLA